MPSKQLDFTLKITISNLKNTAKVDIEIPFGVGFPG